MNQPGDIFGDDELFGSTSTAAEVDVPPDIFPVDEHHDGVELDLVGRLHRQVA